MLLNLHLKQPVILDCRCLCTFLWILDFEHFTGNPFASLSQLMINNRTLPTQQCRFVYLWLPTCLSFIAKGVVVSDHCQLYPLNSSLSFVLLLHFTLTLTFHLHSKLGTLHPLHNCLALNCNKYFPCLTNSWTSANCPNRRLIVGTCPNYASL